MNNSSIYASEPWRLDGTDRKLPGSAVVLDRHYIIVSLLVNIGLQLCFFTITVFTRLQRIKDGAGGMVFFVVSLMTLCLAQTFERRQIIVTCFVCMWAVRLSAYLLLRSLLTIPPVPALENNVEPSVWPTDPVRFAIFWTFQAVWVFVVSFPVVMINSPVYLTFPAGESEPLSDSDSLGIVMWCAGFLCEFFADFQKFLFKRKCLNEDKFCTDDLWTWSRHPNYFGEMTQWWGIFVIYTQIIHEDWMWIGICSPLFVSTVLLFVQMPALEQHSDIRFGLLPEYQEYKQTTSPLIPMPPELYIKFPRFIQMLIFFEFPLYNYLPEEARENESDKGCPKAVRRLEMPY